MNLEEKIKKLEKINGPELKEIMKSIDNGRFKALLDHFTLDDNCFKCNFFNLSIKDVGFGFRCYSCPSCPAATLHPRVISYLNWKSGLITAEEHEKKC